MQAKIVLKGNDANSWHTQENIYFIGYFFDSEDILYRDMQAVYFIKNQLRNHSLEDVCKKLNGVFTFIIQEQDVKIVSDAINFFPIFYAQLNDKLIISDSWDFINQHKGNFEFNNEAVAEYETAGFVLLNETLEKNIFKNNANQILTLEGKTSSSIQYKSFITEAFSEKYDEELAEEAENVLMNVGERLIKFLNGRTAIVPLSGGYDSRLIVSLLKRMNYRDVICFTYGKPNQEVPISSVVAEKLDYEWYFIDFTKTDVEKVHSSQHYKDYLDFAANGFSMPYLMEYFAVASLKKDKIIPDNAVFLPGHSGDFLGGSYINKTVKNKLKLIDLPKLMESKYFIFTKKSSSYKQQIQNRIKQSLLPIGRSFIYKDYNMTVEEWDIQEKLSKFIFHSSQVFNFFGYEVYFPLWDKDLKDFFRSVPFQYRENKKLYDNVLDDVFFRPYDISFSGKELKASRTKIFLQKLKDSVRYFFPWQMVLKRVNNADWPHYQLLTKDMLKFIEEKKMDKFVNFKTYNAVICAWYINYIKEKYSN